jgi:hypothetical protein
MRTVIDTIATYLDVACFASRVLAVDVAARMGVDVYEVDGANLPLPGACYFRVGGRDVVHIDRDVVGLERYVSVIHELTHVMLARYVGDCAYDEEAICDGVAFELLARRREFLAAAGLEDAELVAANHPVENERPLDHAEFARAVSAA